MWQIAKLPSGIGVYWFVIRLSKAAWERTVVLGLLFFFVFFGLVWAGAVRHPHVGHAVPGSGSASVEKTRVAVARLGAPSSSMTTIVLGWPGGLSVSIGT